MQLIRFLNNWSLSWGECRYEIRLWRWGRKPKKGSYLEFIDWKATTNNCAKCIHWKDELAAVKRQLTTEKRTVADLRETHASWSARVRVAERKAALFEAENIRALEHAFQEEEKKHALEKKCRDQEEKIAQLYLEIDRLMASEKG